MYYIENTYDYGARLIDVDTLEILDIDKELAKDYERTHWREDLFNVSLPHVFFEYRDNRILAWYDLRFVEITGVNVVYSAYIEDRKLHIKFADVRGMGNYTEYVIIDNVDVVKKLKISSGVIDHGLCTRSQMKRKVIMA